MESRRANPLRLKAQVEPSTRSLHTGSQTKENHMWKLLAALGHAARRVVSHLSESPRLESKDDAQELEQCRLCFKMVEIGHAHYCDAIGGPCVVQISPGEGELNPIAFPVGSPRINEDENDEKTREEEEADDSLLYGW
jgi:hypothetical protein